MARRTTKQTARGRRRGDRASSGAVAGVVGGLLGLAALVGGVLAFSGDANAAEPKPAPTPEPTPEPTPDPPPVIEDPPDPVEEPAPDPAPGPPPPVDNGGDNWGATPPALRSEFLRAEKAAGIPGMARFLAVWAWGAFRAKQPAVTPAQALEISAANPEWCRTCHNTSASERKASKRALDRVTLPKSQGGDYDKPWPKVTDYAGWTDGSSGLFDILRGAHAHDGIHNNKFTPLIKQPATVLARVDVQLYIAGYMTYRIVHRADLKVIVQGKPGETWANIRACTASPTGYIDLTKGKNTEGAKVAATAKANCLMRAAELGIDLGALPQPLPWAWPGAKAYWNALKVLSGAPMPDNGVPEPDPVGPEGTEDEQADPSLPAMETHSVGGLVAHVYAGNGLSAEAEAPLVVILHGKDANYVQMAQRVNLQLPVRYAFLDATNKRWFDEPLMGDAAILAPQIEAAAAKVVAAGQELTELYPATTKVCLLGYSQGAALAYRIAATGAVNAIVAVAGYVPPSLRPKYSVKTQIWAVQGAQDASVPLLKAQETYKAFGLAAPLQAFIVVEAGGHGLLSLAKAMNEALGVMVMKP